MGELIKIDFSGDNMKVSARELHEFLEVKARYNDWIRNMIQYGFTENVDYYFFSKTQEPNVGGRPQTDAALTLEMAKEICMVTRNEKGKAARQYFLQIERDWNSPDKVMARALKMADATIAKLNAKIEADAPKVEFAENLSISEGCITVKEFSALLCQKGYSTGEHRMFSELREDGFLLTTGCYYNKPAQRFTDMKLFEVKVTSVDTKFGKKVNEQTLITPKGIEYLMGYYLRKHGLQPMLTTFRRRVIEQRPATR